MLVLKDVLSGVYGIYKIPYVDIKKLFDALMLTSKSFYRFIKEFFERLFLLLFLFQDCFYSIQDRSGADIGTYSFLHPLVRSETS